MTAADVPSPDTILAGGQGYEGYRFMGNSLYDSLTKWDLQQGDETPGIIPGLAESWDIDETRTKWTFHLREGVTFHDGTPFDADAVVYNFDRYMNPEAPQYDQTVSGRAGLTAAGVKSYRKVDDSTFEITTNGVWSHLLEDIVFLYIASPTAIQTYGKDYADHPAGTGPFAFESLTRGQQAVLVANEDYWGGAPKVDKLVLKAMPDVSARLAALRAGEVNWVEAPNPDDIAGLESDGYQVLTNSYDHIWPWILNVRTGPLSDAKVRRALNLAIDRESMATDLLKDTADPALQVAPKASAAYREDNDTFSYDPAEAKRLLAEAGYPDGFSMSVSYPTSGSGNMQPGPMNQLLQSDLAKVGVKVELKPIEWAAMLTEFETGKIPDDADAVNISLTFIQEAFWGMGFATGGYTNVGGYSNPEVDKLLGEAQVELDHDKRYDIYAQIAAVVDQDAPWLDVVNDRNPRALSPDVKGFIQPKSWFVDLTTVSVG
ncbi:ABC transporter substrate-binding protein [Nocardioides humi]|nr:ABC transporter substrate-binding protein [Nocardioides humi]